MKVRIIFNGLKYTPQQKFLGFWWSYSCHTGDICFLTKDEALEFLVKESERIKTQK